MEIPAPTLEILKRNALAIQRQNCEITQLKSQVEALSDQNTQLRKMFEKFLGSVGMTLVEDNGRFRARCRDGSYAETV